MSCIKVTINPESNEIKVWNNGKGIPVVEHKDEQVSGSAYAEDAVNLTNTSVKRDQLH